MMADGPRQSMNARSLPLRPPRPRPDRRRGLSRAQARAAVRRRAGRGGGCRPAALESPGGGSGARPGGRDLRRGVEMVDAGDPGKAGAAGAAHRRRRDRPPPAGRPRARAGRPGARPRWSCSSSRATWATSAPASGSRRRPARGGTDRTGENDPWHPDAVRGAAGLQFALPGGAGRARCRESDRPLLAIDPEGEEFVARAVTRAGDPRFRHRAPRTQQQRLRARRCARLDPDARGRLQPQSGDLGRNCSFCNENPNQLVPATQSIERKHFVPSTRQTSALGNSSSSLSRSSSS